MRAAVTGRHVLKRVSPRVILQLHHAVAAPLIKHRKPLLRVTAAPTKMCALVWSGARCIALLFMPAGFFLVGAVSMGTGRRLGYAMDDTSIRTAVVAWLDDAVAAEVMYGHISGWDTSNVTNMGSLFCTRYCADVVNAFYFDEDISAWDTSRVTKMNNMFKYCPTFNKDLSSWSVDAVTSMDTMFYATSSFNHPLGAWNVSNVESMDEMFQRASSFNQPLNAWNVRAVTSMNWMFERASAFNQPLSSWDVRAVKSMREMFASTPNFDQDLSAWTLSSLSDMRSIFSGASAFDQHLSWCLDDNVDLRWAFDDTPCASTSCGVVQKDENGVCPTQSPTLSPTPRPNTMDDAARACSAKLGIAVVLLFLAL